MRNYSISKAWSRISTTAQHTELTVSKRRSENALRAPIFALPTENIIDIFRYVVASDTRRRVPSSQRRANEHLAHVCTHFRDVVLSLSDLWSTIDIPLYWPSNVLGTYVSTMLKRADGTPLCLLAYEGTRDAAPKFDIVELFHRELRRAGVANVESVTFYLTRQEVSRLPARFLNMLPCSPRFLSIQRVTLQQSIGKLRLDLPSTLPYVSLADCPRVATVESIELVDVTLRDVPDGLMSWRSVQVRSRPTSSSRPSSPTTSTSSAGGRIPANVIFQRCPKLQTLVLDGSFSGSLTTSSSNLPPLKELYIRDLVQLRLLGFDGQFTTLSKFGTSTADERLLTRFLKRHPTIVDLTLESMYISESIALACPQLRRLSIPAWLDVLVRSRSAHGSPASGEHDDNDDSSNDYFHQSHQRNRASLSNRSLSGIEAVGYNPLFTRTNQVGYNPLLTPDTRDVLLTSLEYLQLDCQEFPLSTEQFSELVETRVLRAAENGYPKKISQISVRFASSPKTSRASARREQELAWTRSPYLDSAQVRWKENACHLRWR